MPNVDEQVMKMQRDIQNELKIIENHILSLERVLFTLLSELHNKNPDPAMDGIAFRPAEPN